jgi:sulfite reductase (NADPH) flavoprotein alpha-component
MDAVPKASEGKGGKAGAAFFADFGAVMTGALPKTTFLRPSVAWPLAVETLRQLVTQHVLRTERAYYSKPEGALLSRELARTTSWDAQCLIDPAVKVGCCGVGDGDGKDAEAEQVRRAVDEVFRAADDARKPRVLVLHGSEYGFSRELALGLAERLGDAGASARCLGMAQHACVDWARERLVLAVCSTAGDGDPPAGARACFEALRARQADLARSRFAVLAPGDRAYPKFAAAGKELRELLLACGGTELVPLMTLESDDAEEAAPWLAACVAACCGSNGQQPPESSAASGSVPEVEEEKEEEGDYLRARVRANEALFAAPKGATRERPTTAVVTLKRLLTQDDLADKDAKETWHIELRVAPEEAPYEPGDALGVQPTNAPNEVEAVLAALGLRRSDPAPASAAQHADAGAFLDHANLKDALGELKRAPEEHALDVLLRVQPRPSRAQALQLLARFKPLQPRFYSIASSPAQDHGSVHLCVAAVRYETLGRSRQGVASTFLIDRCKVGTSVKVWVQRNPAFRLPARGPAIMIGPGTGLAPFRGFMRHADATRAGPPQMLTLFFGCRSESRDWLYKDEVLQWRARDEQHHQLHLAFSRDQKHKVYVQDRLREASRDVWRLISEQDAQVFICGEGHRMAADVKAALCDIVVDNGGARNKEEAQRLMDKRLHLDVWVS